MFAPLTSQLQLVSAESFAASPNPELPWLWDGLLAPGMITLMTSRWKAGKTTLVSRLLKGLTKGETFAGSQLKPAKAVVLTEEPLSLWQHRHQSGEYGPGIQFSCRPFRGLPTPQQWADLLRELAETPTDLIVIDPLVMFLPGPIENSASSLVNALEPLHALSDQGKALLLLHHPRKGGPADEISPRGTGALTGLADILIDLDRPLNSGLSDRVRRLRVTSRLRGSFRRLIELTEDGRDYIVLPEPADKEGFEAGWPVLKDLLDDADNRMTRKAILQGWPDDHDKPSKATLVRWLERAEKDGLIDRHGQGRCREPYKYFLKGQSPCLEELPPLEPLKRVLFGRR
ncbi:hypothetical protein BH11PLA2_BH11PLA2_44130 [soil metagenome]